MNTTSARPASPANKTNRSVLQDWVHALPFMQQAVLIAAVRGPDGIRKDHPVKVLCRWLRRSFLLSAFTGEALLDPMAPGGGSFTGPSVTKEDFEFWNNDTDEYVYGKMTVVSGVDHGLDLYLRTVDELPHHFQLHFMHAAEILGYKHPEVWVRMWWNNTYRTLVNDMHLFAESEEQMDRRLGDVESQWREREEVTAK